MFTLPVLEYPYDALEPYIDKETMLIHHTKHHQAYLNNLNNILTEYPQLQKSEVEYLLKKSDTLPEEIRTKFINNGGGFINHNLYWKVLSPGKTEPSALLKEAIENAFGSFEIFKEKLSTSALNHFGSGWGWLTVNSGKLEVVTTSNQNSPVSDGIVPILGIDVWEHAYYLKYKNMRVDYINALWNVVNWKAVSQLFSKSIK